MTPLTTPPIGVAYHRNYNMTYKLIKNTGGEIDCVLNINTKSSIPFDPDNTDYQAYLAWLELGNEPLPADEIITP